MSLTSLSKEQKQYLVLGVIVSIALVILITFGIQTSLSSTEAVRMELIELTGKIEESEAAVKKSQDSHEQFCATIEELNLCLTNMPPDRNYYSWATEIVYDVARSVHLDIDTIDEIIINGSKKKSAEQGAAMLETYALRITAHGGYLNVTRFLGQFSSEYPLVRISGVEIHTGSEPDIHAVQVFIEWPFNMDYAAETLNNIIFHEPLARRKSTPSEKTVTEPPDRKKTPVPPPPRDYERQDPLKQSARPDSPLVAGMSGQAETGVSADKDRKSSLRLQTACAH